MDTFSLLDKTSISRYPVLSVKVHVDEKKETVRSQTVHSYISNYACLRIIASKKGKRKKKKRKKRDIFAPLGF